MNEQQSGRRTFIKHAAAGVGGFALTPLDVPHSHPTGQQKKLTVVCVGAHPGDPEFGCGGTMARYSDAGHNVIFMYLTRGEASDASKSYKEMAALRTKEADLSTSVLKATAKYVGQIDGETVLDKMNIASFEKLLTAEKPDLVFAHWPMDSHSDHQVAGMLALTAWVRAARTFQLYFYEVNTGSETMAFVPTDYVHITSVRERKKQAMFAHKTQDPINTYTKFFEPLEKFRGLESGVEAAEAFIHFKGAGLKTSITGM